VNIKQANLFAIVSLVLLGVFLLYWVQAEFKTQKEFLKNEIELEVEKKAFSLALDSIKTELGKLDSVLAIEKNELFKEKFEEVFGKSITLSISSTNNAFDTVEMSLNINLTKKAFFKILPQLFFAMAIFGLVLLTMYLFRQTVVRQEALSLERTNLISNLTHELKTPVATISVALEAISNFGVLEDKEKTKRYINNAQKELKRLTTGINEMLKVSKLDEDNPYFKMEMVVLNELCENAVESISATAKQANVELNVEISSVVLKTYGEAQHLENVIINLLDNAIKYRKPTNAKIDLLLKDAGENILLEVIDNGIGMDKKHHHKIFERFYRVTEENIHNVKGYGLGLSYVKKVLDAHRAKITIDSALNKGSKFSITFEKI